MESAAKKKNSLAMGVIGTMIVWASALLFSSAANASSASHVGLKSRAEVSGPFTAKSVEHLAASPANAARYYDSLDEASIECTVAAEEAAKNAAKNLKKTPTAPMGAMTPNQQALKELVDETTLGGRRPLTTNQAETVLDWADEVGYPGVRAKPGDVADPSNWTGNPVPHIHLPGAGRGGHVPVQPGVRPR